MSFVINTVTNASTTAVFLTQNQEVYNKIIYCNNQTKNQVSKMNCIIQAIKVMIGFKEKVEELVKMADIINNTITVITWQNN